MNNSYRNLLIDHKIKLLVLVHLIFAIYSVGHLHPDEHFQIFEFLGYKLGQSPASDLPWEFNSHMRPWLQPFIYYWLALPLKLIGVSNFLFMSIIRVLHSILALYLTLQIYSRFREQNTVKNVGSLSLFIIFNLIWFFPFLHARVSSEVVGGLLFFYGYFQINHKLSKRSLFLIGMIWGVAIQVRYHIGIMTVAYLANFLIFNFRDYKKALFILLGVITITVLSLFIDFWGYGQWSLPPWNYLYENLVLGKASSFGESPWYFYFKKIHQKAIPPFSWLIIFSFFFFWIKKWRHPLTWLSLSFFIVHCMISHKELRFLFPLAPLTPVFLVFLLDSFRKVPFAINFIIFINLFFIPISLWRSPNPFVSFLRNIDQIQIENFYYVGGESPYGLAKLKPNFIVGHFPPFVTRISEGRLIESELVKSSKPLHLLVIHANDLHFVPDKCQLIWSRIPAWIIGTKVIQLMGKSKIMAFYKCN